MDTKLESNFLPLNPKVQFSPTQLGRWHRLILINELIGVPLSMASIFAPFTRFQSGLSYRPKNTCWIRGTDTE
jgi:hypothetical protein